MEDIHMRGHAHEEDIYAEGHTHEETFTRSDIHTEYPNLYLRLTAPTHTLDLHTHLNSLNPLAPLSQPTLNLLRPELHPRATSPSYIPDLHHRTYGATYI